MTVEPQSLTAGPIYVEVTVTLRLYAKSQAHAVLEVDDRLVRAKDQNMLHIVKSETKSIQSK